MMDWIMPILSVFGGLGGLAALMTWWLNWRKAKPEIAKMYEEMATKQAEQITQLRDMIERNRVVINRLRKVLGEWEEGIRMLIEQIKNSDMEPVWFPKSMDGKMENFEFGDEEKK